MATAATQRKPFAHAGHALLIRLDGNCFVSPSRSSSWLSDAGNVICVEAPVQQVKVKNAHFAATCADFASQARRIARCRTIYRAANV